jgi:hypothetical protein
MRGNGLRQEVEEMASLQLATAHHRHDALDIARAARRLRAETDLAQMTKLRKVRSAWLLVGSTPGVLRNVHSAWRNFTMCRQVRAVSAWRQLAPCW